MQDPNSFYLEKAAKALEKIAKKYCEEEAEDKVLAIKPKTRIDIFREMPNAKFADLVSKQMECDRCPILKTYCMLGDSCRNSWLKFLEDVPADERDIFAKKED